jgi:hypothetical protein
MPDGPIPASVSKPIGPPASDTLTALPAYLVDAFQRRVLFLDLLRRRGNEQIDISSRPTATVLRFASKAIMSGKSLPRPMHYTLSRIIAPEGVVIDEVKRPVVVVDPRAGQGPGIGGFNAEREIGDALKAGHPQRPRLPDPNGCRDRCRRNQTIRPARQYRGENRSQFRNARHRPSCSDGVADASRARLSVSGP